MFLSGFAFGVAVVMISVNLVEEKDWSFYPFPIIVIIIGIFNLL